MNEDRYGRRHILKVVIGGVAAVLVLPSQWSKPIIKSVVAPAHAATSPAPTTTLPGSTTLGPGTTQTTLEPGTSTSTTQEPSTTTQQHPRQPSRQRRRPRQQPPPQRRLSPRSADQVTRRCHLTIFGGEASDRKAAGSPELRNFSTI
jgi:hypothetical protein